jgi:hypothetical protein
MRGLCVASDDAAASIGYSAAMQSKARTVGAYLAELPEDRRKAIEAVRQVILKNLDRKYAEGMSYGMIGYYIPHSVYPPGYHCDPTTGLPFACLASQKGHMAVYLMSADADNGWLRKAWAKTGKKLDMGKSCIRFKKLDDLALDVIGEAIKRMPVDKYIEYYESAMRDISARKKTTSASTRSRTRGAAGGRRTVPRKKKSAKAAPR